jgi:enoyl-CoA hydratase/carnithine racemase
MSHSYAASPYWSSERDGNVAILSYGLPEPLPGPIDAMAEFNERVRALKAESDPPVLVLAVGILHADLHEVRELTLGRSIHDFMPWNDAKAVIEDYPLPVIAAVPVRATAGGTELILACDVRVLHPDARVGLLESRLGIIPGGGGTQRLPRLVGPGNAADLIYDGRAITGDEAYRIGFAQRLDDDPVTAARSLAHRYAERGDRVLRAIKDSLRAAANAPLAEGLRAEGRAMIRAMPDSDAPTRIQAWIDAPGALD